MTAWATELPPTTSTSTSEVETGVGGGPCPPPGTPPFAPEAVAGAYNSNVNAYTPYFVHLTRKDTEQEITSYSLVLPKGITGKLAGIPFCSEANIEAARLKRGAEETANPSCPDGEPGGLDPDRLRGRQRRSPTPPVASTSAAPTTARRSRW